MAKQREQWGSSTGFIVATIGAAVGLGNIWRFSYVAGENGGGVFLIVYLLSVFLVGAPIVIAEMALGRRGGGDAVAAFEIERPRSRWRYVGWVGVAGSLLIMSYYSVIAGWALKYFVGGVTGALWQSAGAGYGNYFTQFIGNTGEPIAWQLAMIGLTMFVVAGGVRGGIELASKVLMPLLALFVIGLAIYSATLPGASAGWRFLFVPDWEALRQRDVYIAAMGQAFFSLGIGMAVFITYASYMSRETRLPVSAVAIVIGDSLFAVVAGLAIFPAVFAFGMDPVAGPKLAFITLPQIFLQMPGGALVGLIFFGLLVAAALTSMVSLVEVSVAALMQRGGFRRWGAVTVAGVTIFALGIPSALSYGLLADIQPNGRNILDFVDQIVSNYLLPFGGITVCLFVGWVWSRQHALAEADLANSRWALLWLWLVRVVAPATILLVLFDSTGAL